MRVKAIYLSALVFLCLSFLILLYKPVTNLFHETDLWWMMPTIAKSAVSDSFWGAFKIHIFDPYYTSWGEPTMNIYFFLIHQFIGFHIKYFTFAALIIHFISSILLYLVVRELGLDFRSAVLTAFVYMTAFIHSQYYIWPMSAHHRAVIFFTLLVWYLYLKTSRLIYTGSCWRGYFRLTLFVNLLASFSQITILILPASILAHMLLCASDNSDRIRRYDMWLPLFITYLGWPLIRLLYIRYPNIENTLHMSIPQVESPALFLVFFLLGLTALLSGRYGLRLSYRYNFRGVFLRAAIAGAVLYSALFLWAYWNKGLFSPFHQRKILLADFLSPHNLIRPFVSMFMSFLAPLKVLSAVDSALPYYYIPLKKADSIYVLTTLFFLFVFARRFLKNHKGLIIFFILYAIALPNMWRRGPMITSRHFVYITPLFSVVFASVFTHLYILMSDKIKLKSILKELVLALVFVGFGIFNILGIRLYMFEGRLPNTFLIYDYIKTAYAIKDDIASVRVNPANIYIDNVQVMPFKEYWDCGADPLRFDTFRYTFAQVLSDKEMVSININKSGSKAKGSLVYTLRDSRIDNSNGIDIDPFARDFENAVKELKAGRYEKASNLFQKAYARRPFLFNYVLGSYGLEDLKWITNGRTMRKWTNDIVDYYNSWQDEPIERSVHISNILKREIDSFVECVFFLSYLKHLSGNIEESRQIFSDIRFIDRDHSAVLRLLAEGPAIGSDRKTMAFLKKNIILGSSKDGGTIPPHSFLLGLVLNKDQNPL